MCPQLQMLQLYRQVSGFSDRRGCHLAAHGPGRSSSKDPFAAKLCSFLQPPMLIVLIRFIHQRNMDNKLYPYVHGRTQ